MLAVLLAVSLAAAPDAQYKVDRYECLKESVAQKSGAMVMGNVGAGSSEQVINERLYNACMEARGYELAPPPDNGPMFAGIIVASVIIAVAITGVAAAVTIMSD